jgi:hypothetical protein
MGFARITALAKAGESVMVILVSPSGMVETVRFQAKYRLCEMVGQSLVTYPSWDWNEADHEHLNNIASELSFP